MNIMSIGVLQLFLFFFFTLRWKFLRSALSQLSECGWKSLCKSKRQTFCASIQLPSLIWQEYFSCLKFFIVCAADITNFLRYSKYWFNSKSRILNMFVYEGGSGTVFVFKMKRKHAINYFCNSSAKYTVSWIYCGGGHMGIWGSATLHSLNLLFKEYTQETSETFSLDLNKNPSGKWS